MSRLLRACSAPMKGSRASSRPASTPEGSSEGVDLSLTGLPPPVSWRPNSASAAKPIARSFSVVAGSEPRRKAPVSAGAGCRAPRRAAPPLTAVASSLPVAAPRSEIRGDSSSYRPET